MAKFCRNGLQSLLQRFECAATVTHHTPKANNRDTSAWRPSDWQYAGHGSADLTNWTRAMLVVDATREHGIFRFIAAKRGGRFGWVDDEGKPAYDQYFRHAREAGVIRWEEAAPDEIEALRASAKVKAKLPTEAEFIELLPPVSTLNPSSAMITMAELETRAMAQGFTKNGLSGVRDGLAREGKIHAFRDTGRARA